MRKIVLAAAASLLVLSACGSKSSSTQTTDTFPLDTTPLDTTPVDTTPPVPLPTVKLPATLPTALQITALKPGLGDKAATGDKLMVRYLGVRSRDGKEFDNNYNGDPFEVDLGAGSVIKGWEQGLLASQAGERLQLDVPGSLAYGSQAKDAIIGPNEALTFIIDVLAVIHPTDPTAEPVLVIKPGKVTSVVVDDLIPGTGAAAQEGQTIVFNYIFYRVDTGGKLYSSWSSTPATIQLAKGVNGDTSLDSLIGGLIGQKVGGRRQITVPAAQAFGGTGDSGLGLPVGVDVVLVADLLAAY